MIWGKYGYMCGEPGGRFRVVYWDKRAANKYNPRSDGVSREIGEESILFVASAHYHRYRKSISPLPKEFYPAMELWFEKMHSATPAPRPF